MNTNKIVLVILLLFYVMFLNYHIVFSNNSSFENDFTIIPFLRSLKFYSSENSILNFLTIGILSFITAILVIAISNNHSLLPKRTFYPGFVFVSGFSFFQSSYCPLAELIAIILLLFALNLIFLSYKKPIADRNIFYASLIISISGFFNFHVIWISLVVIFWQVSTSRIDLQNVLLWLMGIFTPYLIVGSIYFLNSDFDIFTKYLLTNISFKFSIPIYTTKQLVVFGLFTSISIIYIGFFIKQLFSQKVSTRKIIGVFAFLFFSSIFILYLSEKLAYSIGSIAFTIYISFCISGSKRAIVNEIVTIIILGIPVINLVIKSFGI